MHGEKAIGKPPIFLVKAHAYNNLIANQGIQRSTKSARPLIPNVSNSGAYMAIKQPPTVFISSIQHSVRCDGCVLFELQADREIAVSTVREIGMKPIFAECSEALSEESMTALCQAVRDSDIAVFLLWQLYSNKVIKEYQEAKKCGLPRLVFIRSLPKEAKRQYMLEKFIDSELKGDNTGIQYKEYESLEQLRSELKVAIMSYTGNQFRQSVYREFSIAGMYNEAANVAVEGDKIYCLSQRSPSIIFPSSFEEGTEAREAENRLKSVLESWLARIRQDPDQKLLLVGAVEESKKEYKHLLDADRRNVISRLKELNEIECGQGNFKLGWLNSGSRELIISCASTRRYGILIRNPLPKEKLGLSPIALLCGANEGIAKAICNYTEFAVEESHCSTEELIKMLRKLNC